MILWLTGLPCSGKTTLGRAVVDRLLAAGRSAELLDGDVLRRDRWKDLGFTQRDREENVRRIGRLAEELTSAGVIAVVSAVSPYRAIRDEVRGASSRFVEVYVNAPLNVCEGRDPKGLYKKARAGEIHGFTGIDDPYEEPLEAEIRLNTHECPLKANVDMVVEAILSHLG